MFKNGAYYNGIGPWLKERFGTRIVKLSIDGGFTCPNRDGTKGFGGCIFCSESGSGDFAGASILRSSVPVYEPTAYVFRDSSQSAPSYRTFASAHDTGLSDSLSNQPAAGLCRASASTVCPPALPICSDAGFILRPVPPVQEQVSAQIAALKNKWKNFRWIAYFQNFTNTYAPVSVLREKYEEALQQPGCVGLAIATRPDCLDDNVTDLLSELNSRTFLWVELGLQTSNDTTARLIRRACSLSAYDDAVKKLSARKIAVVTHLIAGLPGETHADFLHSVMYAADKKPFGIKLQLLHIMKNTELGDLYMKQLSAPGTGYAADRFPPIRPLEKDEYISLIADALELIPSNVTIHRLTGDAPKDLLIAPQWSRDKKSVLNGINMELKKRGTYQGAAAPSC